MVFTTMAAFALFGDCIFVRAALLPEKKQKGANCVKCCLPEYWLSKKGGCNNLFIKCL